MPARLSRETVAVLVAVLCLGLGEELWSQFFPDFLKTHLKATILGIACYSAGFNLMEAGLYMAGGSLAQRLGVRAALVGVTIVPIVGYAALLHSTGAETGAPGWLVSVIAIAGALAVKAAESLAVPSTFVILGAAPPKGRALAFALQSVQKRLPKVLGPGLAGIVLTVVGLAHGMRGLLVTALALAVVSLVAQWILLARAAPPKGRVPLREALAAMDPGLRRLLPADVAIRWCDWMVRDFAVIYLVSTPAAAGGFALDRAVFGGLVALQMTVSLASYAPAAFLGSPASERRLIGVTYVFFTAFPLLLALATGPAGLVLAYAANGLRELGEPARKALITMRFPERVRASGVGAYWGVRSLLQCPAPLVAAGVWLAAGPQALLFTAFGCGCVGLALYAVALPALRFPASAGGADAGDRQ